MAYHHQETLPIEELPPRNEAVFGILLPGYYEGVPQTQLGDQAVRLHQLSMQLAMDMVCEREVGRGPITASSTAKPELQDLPTIPPHSRYIVHTPYIGEPSITQDRAREVGDVILERMRVVDELAPANAPRFVPISQILAQ